jgi:D-arabinose 1-dehydrogenase-like Zn-dependent alcohol dehydrogenase
MVAGHEIAGHVVKAGSAVSELKIGDYVGAYFQRNFCGTCEFCLKGETQLCQMDGSEKYIFNPYFGGFATHVQIPARCAIPIPATLKPEYACSLMCAGITVFSPLHKYGGKGKTCAVIGIGGLGHLAVQYAAKMGMEVTAFSATESKTQFCKEMGATHVVNSKDLTAVQNHSGKYDVVIQTLFGTECQDLYTAYSALPNVQGMYVVVGLPHANFKCTFDQFHVVTKETSVVGSLIGSVDSYLKKALLKSERSMN